MDAIEMIKERRSVRKFNDKAISKIVGLPEEEAVAALIVYGYPDGPHPAPTPRKNAEDIMRFIG